MTSPDPNLYIHQSSAPTYLSATMFCQQSCIPQHNDICRTSDGQIEDILSDPAFNARTRVHEYGGGEYVVGKDAVYFSNFK